MKTASSRPVMEQDVFLDLWPHRFDYIYAPHPNPEDKPDWKTESRHPISDRLIHQGAFLYGVRFGPKTQYCMLDIDRGSPYHPNRDRLAINRINQALEPVGLVQSLTCTSSRSGGLHVYFPFIEPQSTWEVALAVTTLLENAGFKVAAGILEVFPNAKPYSPDGNPSLYHGHRLPMQAGSYLLNDQMEPIWSSKELFAQQWHFAQQRNDINSTILDQTLRQARRRQFRVSTKAEKFLNDLNAEIELGWTGPGQTNRLLGRIAMRSYIFGHVLYASTPLTGDALTEDITNTARTLPGFTIWCQHQHELEHKAADWARCIEASGYYHYGHDHPDLQEDLPVISWNDLQQQQARERITQALGNLLEEGKLPSSISERFDVLCQYSLSGATLYRHKDLWHPRFITPVEIPPHPPKTQNGMMLSCLREADSTSSHPNLLVSDGCKPALEGSFNPPSVPPNAETGCKSFLEASSGDQHQETSQPPPPNGPAFIRYILQQIQQRQRQQKDNRYSQTSAPAAATTETQGSLFSQEKGCPRLLGGEGTANIDRSDIMATIALYQDKLQLTPGQVSQHLTRLFGKPSPTMLSRLELLQWLDWLQRDAQ